MNFQIISSKMEQYIAPLATKLGQQRHLRAVRDAFMSIMPITLAGGIAAILKSAPITEDTTNGFLLAWAKFGETHANVLGWVNALTLGAMSLYICIGITYFLSKHFKEDPFRPIVFSILAFMMLVTSPIEMGWDSKSIDIIYIDGKGLIPAIIISILTVELYHIMRKKELGRIKLPDSVPSSLSETFATLVPGLVLICVYTAIFAIFNAFNTTFTGAIYDLIAPSFKATDSLFFTILIAFLVHLFWFFGIHDAALAGILGPIRDGNLSNNAVAHEAGEALPHIFTTPFWTYFVIIGGSGAVLALGMMMLRSKSKQLRTVGKVGFGPAIFGISEPLIFGTPLMLNPIFLFPFIFAAIANGTIAYLLMNSGVIGKTFAMFSWQMPSPIGAFLSTMDGKAIVLIIGLIILDGLIYYPFFKMYEKQLVKMENGEVEPTEE